MPNQNFTQQDSGDNRALGIIMSLFTFLFFLPFIVKTDSIYLKFRANQTLIVFILDAVVGVIAKIPIIGWFSGILGFFVLILSIINLVYACQEQNTGKPLPIVGNIEIIK